MGSSHLHSCIDSVTPPNLATIRLNRQATTTTPEPVDTDTPLPLRISGDYELMTLLGRGGMGIVYLARQRGLKRNVAYKMLTQLASLDPDTLERFRVEAETLAKLQHSGIVQVFDSGSIDNSPFLVMEYVGGGSMAEKLSGARVSPCESATLIATVASAVGYAHSHGIIHRDLKPANILLTPEGQPKVADFGLARDIGTAHLTRTGFIAGTPCYMAPEQLAGQRDLTSAVDVWALGVILYEMLTGTLPFAGSDPQQILTNIFRNDPVPPRQWRSNLHRDLETICLKCLQKDPTRRYPTGTELAEDLDRYLKGQPIHARPIGHVEKGIRWCRRNPLASTLLAGIALTLITATSVSLLFADTANRERIVAQLNARQAVEARVAEQKLREAAERSAIAEKKAREDTERITTLLDNLLAGLRSGPDPLEDLVRQMDQTATSLEADPGDPLTRARLFFTLGMTYRNLGKIESAIRMMEIAYAIRLAHLKLDDSLTRYTASQLSYTYYHLSRNDDAIRILMPTIEKEIEISGEDSAMTLHHLGLLSMYYSSAGRFDDEAKLSERILASKIRIYGVDHESTEWTRINQSKYQVAAGNFKESIPILRKAYGRLLAVHGPYDERTSWARVTLGLSHLRNGEPQLALPYLELNYRDLIAAKNMSHIHTIYGTVFLAECYEGLDRPEAAAPLRELLANHYKKIGDIANASIQESKLNQHRLALKDKK